MLFSLCVVTGCPHTASGTPVCAVVDRRAARVQDHSLSISKARLLAWGGQLKPTFLSSKFEVFFPNSWHHVSHQTESLVSRGAPWGKGQQDGLGLLWQHPLGQGQQMSSPPGWHIPRRKKAWLGREGQCMGQGTSRDIVCLWPSGSSGEAMV